MRCGAGPLVSIPPASVGQPDRDYGALRASPRSLGQGLGGLLARLHRGAVRGIPGAASVPEWRASALRAQQRHSAKSPRGATPDGVVRLSHSERFRLMARAMELWPPGHTGIFHGDASRPAYADRTHPCVTAIDASAAHERPSVIDAQRGTSSLDDDRWPPISPRRAPQRS